AANTSHKKNRQVFRSRGANASGALRTFQPQRFDSNPMRGNPMRTTRSANPSQHRMAPLARALLLALLGGGMAVVAPSALAQTAGERAVREFNVPAGNLDQALSRFGQQAGVQLAVDARLTAGLTSP